KFLQAREYFQQIVENYPQSTYRPDAKLGLGDTYIGENSTESLILAQNEFKARNAELPENRRMEFRIGVNLGDVIEEEGRIYGDGVNIASRLEGLATIRFQINYEHF
ncbi:MAG: Adenylyl cyclase class-3/4/guanylyl cyclase, partial [Candidatus Woesebacteria bacterium GW2011_GWF2_46_8]